jgi:hypothetical protein
MNELTFAGIIIGLVMIAPLLIDLAREYVKMWNQKNK